jgi:hypothetical protein
MLLAAMPPRATSLTASPPAWAWTWRLTPALMPAPLVPVAPPHRYDTTALPPLQIKMSPHTMTTSAITRRLTMTWVAGCLLRPLHWHGKGHGRIPAGGGRAVQQPVLARPGRYDDRPCRQVLHRPRARLQLCTFAEASASIVCYGEMLVLHACSRGRRTRPHKVGWCSSMQPSCAIVMLLVAFGSRIAFVEPNQTTH